MPEKKNANQKNPWRFLLQGEGETKYVCAVDWSSRDKRSNLIHREISASEGQKPKVVCCFCWHKRQWQKLKCWVLYNGIQICWFTSHSLNVYLCPRFFLLTHHMPSASWFQICRKHRQTYSSSQGHFPRCSAFFWCFWLISNHFQFRSWRFYLLWWSFLLR